MRLSIPLRLPSLANTRLCWQRIAALKKKQKSATRISLMYAQERLPQPPLLVTITRVGRGRLDDDNLAGACKYVRDAIAAAVGLDDGSPLYTWRYEQRVDKQAKYSVEVEITAR